MDNSPYRGRFSSREMSSLAQDQFFDSGNVIFSSPWHWPTASSSAFNRIGIQAPKGQREKCIISGIVGVQDERKVVKLLKLKFLLLVQVFNTSCFPLRSIR